MCLAVSGRIVAIHRGLAGADVPRSSTAADGDDSPGQATADSPGQATPDRGDGDDDPLWRMAEVDFGGVRQTVSLACLPEARLGDRVLVHVGLALSVVE